MIRCGNCKVIQKDGTPVCTACGTTLDATGAPAPSAPAGSAPVLPNQGPRGPGSIVPGQGGVGPARPGATPPVAPAPPPTAPPAMAPVVAPMPPPAAPPVAPVPPPVAPVAPPVAPPVGRPAGPVVLGPASDPGVGSRSSGSFPGAGGVPPVGSIPVVVGPPPKDDGGGKGLKVAAIIGSSLVLVLLIALVVVLSSRPEEVIAADTTTTTSTTTSTSTTTTTAPPIPAALTLNPFDREYIVGETVSFSAGFAGDPNAVKATAMFVNGFPNLPHPGLNLTYEFPASTVGTVTVKIVATLQNDELRESNEVVVNVIAPPTTTTTTQPPPPPPTYACYGCRRITIRSGLSDVKLRAAPNTNSAVRGTVATGTPLMGDCRVTGEYISRDGTSTSTWDRLSDGSYVWDGFIVELLDPC